MTLTPELKSEFDQACQEAGGNRTLTFSQKRAAYQRTASDILDKAKREKRELTESEQRDFDRLITKSQRYAQFLEILNGETERAVAERELQSAFGHGDDVLVLRHGQRISDARGIHAPGGDFGGFRIGYALRGITLGDWRGADVEKRALGGASGSGSYLLPTDVATAFIDMARSNAVCLQAGVQTYSTREQNFNIPKISGDVTAAWRAEGEEISESDPVFTKIEVRPKSLACLIRLSNELLADAPGLASRMIESSIVGAMSVAMDTAILRGSGSNNVPAGIRYASNVQVSNATNPVAATDLVDAWEKIANENGTPTGIIMAPKFAAYLGKLTDNNAAWKSLPPLVAELPRFYTTSVPTNLGSNTNESEIYMADFRQAALMLREEMVIQASGAASDAFAKNQTLIRAILRADVAVMQPKHFAVLTACKTGS